MEIKEFLIATAALLLSSCSAMMMEPPPPPADTSPAKLLLVIEQSQLTALSDSISVYTEDITASGGSVDVKPFPSDGSADELKALIASYKENVDGAFLVGDLPAAWYEQTAFGKEEEFPIDLYFMDFEAVWEDSDGDGIFDGHSPLNLTHYVSRIAGSTEEIITYFDKLHNYRTGSYAYLGGAFIFKDEDWFDTYRGSSFGLDRMYGDVTINEDADVTLKDDYLYRVAYEGADYVYQWIHATPTSLYISDGDYYSTFRYREIPDSNVQSRFLNMFNCKGARFTQSNLGMTYLTGTDSGLAVTGSTKVGGNFYPLEFHRTLTLGSNWGNAFKSWYNYYGSKDDEWFLGMVILGDPALHIKDAEIDRSLSRSSFSEIIPPAEEAVKELGKNLTDFETFEQNF